MTQTPLDLVHLRFLVQAALREAGVRERHLAVVSFRENSTREAGALLIPFSKKLPRERVETALLGKGLTPRCTAKEATLTFPLETCPKPTVAGAPLLDFGRNRAVYDRGRYVLKVPRNEEGEVDNSWEADYSRSFKNRPDINGIHYARCRLLANGWLLMEKVGPLPKGSKAPQWADYVDCQQVGVARDGRIVAFDYGYY